MSHLNPYVSQPTFFSMPFLQGLTMQPWFLQVRHACSLIHSYMLFSLSEIHVSLTFPGIKPEICLDFPNFYWNKLAEMGYTLFVTIFVYIYTDLYIYIYMHFMHFTYAFYFKCAYIYIYIYICTFEVKCIFF